MSLESFEKVYNEFNQKLKNREFKEALLLSSQLLDNATNEIDTFYALMGKATALTNLDNNSEVISTYKEIIKKFKNSTDETISKVFNICLL